MKLQNKAKFAVFFIALFLVALILLFSPTEIAFAVLPESYVLNVANKNYDWWLGEKGLDIDTLKKTVDAWKNNPAYDFESLKDNPIVIAVIDSGIKEDHILFTGKYDENGKSVVGATDSNGVGEYDVLLRDGNGRLISKNTHNSYLSVADDAYDRHGTHVAGIIATLIHSLDLEKYIKILPIKASYRANVNGQLSSAFDSEDVEKAVAFALDNGAAVINMSLASAHRSTSASFGGFNKSDAHEKAVLVAAAGNSGEESGIHVNGSGQYEDCTAYPAGNENVIGVMNYTKDGVLSPTSNYGDKYDVCAPGTTIYSANGETTSAYKNLNGTSMASPIVAFGAGLLTLKYRAIQALIDREITAVEIAESVRNAYTSTIGRIVGDEYSYTVEGAYPVFDINKLVGVGWRDAKLVIENPEQVTQYLGRVDAVRISLKVFPSSENERGKVEWFRITNDGDERLEYASGFAIGYTPSDEIGTTIIKAVWTPEKIYNGIDIVEPIVRIFELNVDYLPLNGQTVKQIQLELNAGGVQSGDNLSEYIIGVPYKFSLSKTENFAPITDGNIMWYVNNVYVKSGREYTFTPKKEGEYSICAKINGVFTSPTVMTVVNEAEPDNSFEYELGIISLIVVAVIDVVVAVIAVVIIRKRRKAVKSR